MTRNRRATAMPTSQSTRECETITKELQDRYVLDEELDLKEIAPLMLQLREVLPTPSFKFLLTLCESVFSKLTPDLVQVPVMKKKLEAALAAQAKTLGKRGGDEAASEPPDRLCAAGPRLPRCEAVARKGRRMGSASGRLMGGWGSKGVIG